MQRYLLVSLAICLLTIKSFSQTITTSAILGSPFCAGASFNISYTITGSFTVGNVFTAQLSNASGSFASPVDIGAVTTTFAGVITIILPALQGAGSGYRIRVVGSSPSIIGTDNGTDLTVRVINLNAPTFAGAIFCPESSFTLNYTFVDCDFISGNTFTAELSNSVGSFAPPTTLQSTTTNLAGSYNVIIPTSTPAGNGYRIRLVASNPSRISPDNGTNLTVNAYGINAPTFTGTSFCQGEPLTIGYTIQNGCGFPSLPSANIFTAQLSNSSGLFASPIGIGSVSSTNSGFITAVIPGGTPAGMGYRIRVVSSNPSVIVSADNGINLVVNASSGSPAVFGSNIWNAYVYAGTASPITNNTLFGTYTENNLSFDTKNRWVAAAGPGTANASSGSAYTGCPVPGTNYSISFKRTNFTCGYYQIDIPFQDDWLTLFVNGVQVFQNNSYTPSLQSNVWTGFLGPASTAEFRFINFAAGGQLHVAFSSAPNPLTISDPVIVCSTSSTTLQASSPLSLSYAWTPTTNLTPSNGTGANVVAAPTTTTTYTATGTDVAAGCSVSKSVVVTAIPPFTVPTISLTNLPSTICTGVTTSVLTASGANTYTWSPAAGLNATTGSTVIANPSTTTTYTVTGNTGCQSAANTATVTVQPTPTNPSSAFGNGTWNVYCHNNTTLSNYYGYYTENNLNFNTTSRWASSNGPTGANASSGLAYIGCTFGSTNYSMSFKRTNFTCGYYQIDIPYQDDAVTILINGVPVFQNTNFTPSLQTNVWTGFLGSTTTVEIKFVNTQLSGQLEISINPSASVPQTLNSNSTICVSGSANLSATSLIAGVTYAWSIVDPSSTMTFSNASIANPLLSTTGATPASNYAVTNVLTDAAGSNCTSSKTFVLTVANQSNTTVNPTNATNILTSCTNIGVTLTTDGANNYSWSPADGLSSTTGFSVVAKPLVTTTYTITGSNSCSSKSATTTVTVSPLPAIATFPAGGWNIYGFNSSTVGTNYQGFYAENGFGATGLNFDTRTRWASKDVPSNANASNGLTWQGCPMNVGGTSLSFKRTGFTCGTYQLDVPAHADDFLLFINGTQVAQHVGCCDVHTNLWTGVLTTNSTVEWQLTRNGAESYLQVAFTLITQPTGQTVWLGGASNDWFNAANWCNGIPTASTDILIPAAGPQNMPVINAAGAVAKNVTVNPAIPSGTFTSAIPAASLTSNAFNLEVYGNWTNNGVFTPYGGAISFVGPGSGNTISTATTQTFNNLIINKANGITLSSGTHQVSGTLTFTNGIVAQNSSLIVLSGASVAAASNSSYVDGAIAKVGSTAFTFPVGKGLLYRPITISAPSAATDAYSAQYFNVNPTSTYPIAQRAATLDRVSSAEYWMLNRTTGTSNVNITLSWGSNSEAVGNLSLLRVAAWDGSLWTDQGNGATTGTTASGTVTTKTPSTVYGPFTLDENKLPVGLEGAPSSKTDLWLYPNPATSNASLELNGATFNSISITNNLGQEINCDLSIGSTKVDINTNTLAPGLYIVNISLDQKPSKLKLMIQR